MAMGHPLRLVVHLHGRNLGRLHIRFEHDRHPCGDVGLLGPFHLRGPQGIQPVFHYRHRRCNANPCCRLAAIAISGANGPAPRLRRVPGVGILRHAPAELEDVGRGFLQVPHPYHWDFRGCLCGHCGAPHADWLLRPVLVSDPGLVREAHEDRKSIGGFCCRASACQSIHVCRLLELTAGIRLSWRLRVPLESQQRLLLHASLRIYCRTFLGQDVAVGLDLRSHLLRGRGHLVRLADGPAIGSILPFPRPEGVRGPRGGRRETHQLQRRQGRQGQQGWQGW
mmetsp:Transcript_57191/g.159166  ORF Transcript_57191/g.159166 Transcript_57191/m.159166 type:complete len:281 (+) Transcript_57191:804-1646(+)